MRRQASGAPAARLAPARRASPSLRGGRLGRLADGGQARGQIEDHELERLLLRGQVVHVAAVGHDAARREVRVVGADARLVLRAGAAAHVQVGVDDPAAGLGRRDADRRVEREVLAPRSGPGSTCRG